jgi:hypothetical protein
MMIAKKLKQAQDHRCTAAQELSAILEKVKRITLRPLEHEKPADRE